jgi:hypothetical protein
LQCGFQHSIIQTYEYEYAFDKGESSSHTTGERQIDTIHSGGFDGTEITLGEGKSEFEETPGDERL